MSAQSPRPQPTESDGDGSRMTRRELFQRVGVAAGTVVTVGAGVNHYAPRYSPVGRAQAGVPLVAGVIIGYSVIRYAYGEYAGEDVEAQYNAIDFEDHLNIYNDAREIAEVTDETLLASLETNANSLQNTAREEAVMAMYEAVATGSSRSEAQTAAENAIADTFVGVEKSLVTRLNSLYNGIVMEAKNRSVLRFQNPGDSSTNTDWGDNFAKSETYVYLDGSDSEYMVTGYSGTTYMENYDPMNGTGGAQDFVVTAPDPADYDGVSGSDYDLDHVSGTQMIVDHSAYRGVATAIQDSYDSVISEVESLLSTHYDDMSAGDLSLTDMLSTGAMLETVAGATSWQEAALYFRTVGLPEATEPGRISFSQDDVESVERETVDSSGNTTDGNTTDGNTTDGGEVDLPDGELTLDGKLAWSLSTDVEDSVLPVGSRIDPDTYPGELYAAVEWEDSNGEMQADVIRLVDPFTIVGVNSGSDQLDFEQRDVVTSDTNPDEAADIFEENRESEETARDQTIEVVIDDGGDGPGPIFGGGDWLEGGGGLLGLGIIGVVVLAVFGIVTDAIPGLGDN